MRRTMLTVLPLVVAAGCTTARGAPSVDPNALGLTWVAHLNPTRNIGSTGNRMAGDVRVTPSTTNLNGSHIVLQVTGGALSAQHPWVIASGTCTGLIPVDLGGRAMYPPLELRSDGAGKVTADLPIVIPIDQRYHVALFNKASAMADEEMVACGELAIVNSR